MQQSTDEHGWQSVGPVKSYRLDPSKMKISKVNIGVCFYIFNCCGDL